MPAPEKEENSKKRKRADIDESDPKLREFLETYQPSSRRRKEGDLEAGAANEDQPMAIPEDASDDEYEAIPKRLSTKQPTVVEKPAPITHQQSSVDIPGPPGAEDSPELEDPPEEKRAVDASDDDWLRSRTSRLLDILDPDEEVEQGANVETNPMPTVTESGDQPDETVDAPSKESTRPIQKTDQEQITETRRLFVRNLSYSTSEDELREHFEIFGALDEVRRLFLRYDSLLHDEPLIGTAYTVWYLMRSRAKYFSRCYVYLTRSLLTSFPFDLGESDADVGRFTYPSTRLG